MQITIETTEAIASLSTLSKLYVNILRNKLNKYMEEILGEEQFRL
jgi:hypothetical protein